MLNSWLNGKNEVWYLTRSDSIWPISGKMVGQYLALRLILELWIYLSECLRLMYNHHNYFQIGCWGTCRWPKASWQARRGGEDSCAPRWGWASRQTGPRERLTSAWSPATHSIQSIPNNEARGRRPECPVVVSTAALRHHLLVLRKIQFELRRKIQPRQNYHLVGMGAETQSWLRPDMGRRPEGSSINYVITFAGLGRPPSPM